MHLATEARATPAAALSTCAADLMACGSLEMSPDRGGEVATIAGLVPVGTKVYVNHLPRHALADSLPTLIALRQAGLEPVPHVAARRVLSRPEARAFLERATAEAGVTKVLLIGGDDPVPRGVYTDATALLRDGVIAESGVREIGIAGYPEGHARIAAEALQQSLQDKLALATEQDLGVYMVTQFSFAPARVIEYCSAISQAHPTLPIYVGIAGPTAPAALLRFAQRCGVSASLRALKEQGIAAVQLVTHTDPGEQLAAVAHYCLAHASCNVVGVHLFSFGGAERAAEWMQMQIASGE